MKNMKQSSPSCPCDNCAEREKREFGACNGGFGICEACLSYHREMSMVAELNAEYAAALNN